ncbi:biotin transporter BioY [Lachnospiraceae bacterium LCP25S3_G4]
MDQITNTTNRISTKVLVVISLITAITCILAPFSIPLPFSPVPISFTNLVLYLSVFIIGWKYATISYIIYLLLGVVGLPVFSGFTGGLGKLFGPTGGYLLGFIFLTIISGLFIEKSHEKKIFIILGMVLGTIVCYLFGTIWLAKQLDLTFLQGLAAGVIPYILGDAIKIIIAFLVGPTIKKQVNPFLL